MTEKLDWKPETAPTTGETPASPEQLTEKEWKQTGTLTRYLEVTARLLRGTLQDKNPSPEALEAIRQTIGDTQTTNQLEALLKTLMEGEEKKQTDIKQLEKETLKEQTEEKTRTHESLKNIFEGHIDHQST